MLVYRVKTLKLISSNQARYLYMQLNRDGYSKREPLSLDPPMEKSRLLRNLVDFHMKDLGYNQENLCELLCVQLWELRRMYGFEDESKVTFQLV